MYQIGKIEIALKVVSKIFPEIIWKMQLIVKKKVLCSAEKDFVIWVKPNSISSAKLLAELFCRTKRSVGH